VPDPTWNKLSYIEKLAFAEQYFLQIESWGDHYWIDNHSDDWVYYGSEKRHGGLGLPHTAISEDFSFVHPNGPAADGPYAHEFIPSPS